MSAIKNFIISRKTVVFLISSILTAVVASFVFPQRFITPPIKMGNWILAHPYLGSLMNYLGLDHLYTTAWFAAIICLFTVSLAVSCYDQFMVAWGKTFDIPAGSGKPVFELGRITDDQLVKILRGHGYLSVSRNQELSKFVKSPWGYWGKFLLHGGMVLVIAASLLILLTQKKGTLYLYEGESHAPGDRWLIEEKGLMVDSLRLPMTVRLEEVKPEYWENDDLKLLSTKVTFVRSDGEVSEHRLAINQTRMFDGLKVYQSQEFGAAFFAEFYDDKGARQGVILQIAHPQRRDVAGYQDFKFDWLPHTLKTKYFADSEKRNMESISPQLILRLVNGKRVAGELSLKPGEMGALGEYKVKLVKVKKWAGIIFVDISGMTGIFAGFFIIILGSGLIYFTPPREIVVQTTEGSRSVVWRATNFGECYEDEIARIRSALTENSEIH